LTSKREDTKRIYGTLFTELSLELFQADPMGINFGSNTDEYDPEAESIILRLQTASSAQDVQRIVYEEFKRWFGLKEAGEIDRYELVSLRIWQHWCEFQERKTPS
jgi:hypothetical protein